MGLQLPGATFSRIPCVPATASSSNSRPPHELAHETHRLRKVKRTSCASTSKGRSGPKSRNCCRKSSSSRLTILDHLRGWGSSRPKSAVTPNRPTAGGKNRFAEIPVNPTSRRRWESGPTAREALDRLYPVFVVFIFVDDRIFSYEPAYDAPSSRTFFACRRTASG